MFIELDISTLINLKLNRVILEFKGMVKNVLTLKVNFMV